MSSIDVSKLRLSQLRAFAAVAQYGSFGEAAVQLNVTQSSISHAIATLETELGVVLFTRGRRGASLSFIGEQMIGDVRQILQLLDQVADRAIASRSAQTGQVRIATVRSLATHWLPPILAQFNQQFPQISFTLTKCVDHVEVQTVLRHREADIGFADVYGKAGYSVVEIGWDSYVLLLPAHCFPQDIPITWQHINQYPLIMPSPHDNGYTELRQYVAKLDNPPKIAYEINEDSTIVSMVGQGLGVAILPCLAALPIPGTVKVHPLPQPLTRLLAAVMLEEALHPPAVFTFLDLVKQIGKATLEAQALLKT